MEAAVPLQHRPPCPLLLPRPPRAPPRHPLPPPLRPLHVPLLHRQRRYRPQLPSLPHSHPARRPRLHRLGRLSQSRLHRLPLPPQFLYPRPRHSRRPSCHCLLRHGARSRRVDLNLAHQSLPRRRPLRLHSRQCQRAATASAAVAAAAVCATSATPATPATCAHPSSSLLLMRRGRLCALSAQALSRPTSPSTSRSRLQRTVGRRRAQAAMGHPHARCCMPPSFQTSLLRPVRARRALRSRLPWWCLLLRDSDGGSWRLRTLGQLRRPSVGRSRRVRQPV